MDNIAATIHSIHNTNSTASPQPPPHWNRARIKAPADSTDHSVPALRRRWTLEGRLPSQNGDEIVQAICEFHDECYDGIPDKKDRKTRIGFAGDCMLENFLHLYPGFYSVGGTEGMRIFTQMMASFRNSKELEFEDADVTNAAMHWIYEVLSSDS
ncbi:uncharacterized protein [Dermacentor albipictus]|uniref:uncharacterized protein n=1 Tax=Dermacentor albipictus TaxID=60249 RepID=UPI0031FC91A6